MISLDFKIYGEIKSNKRPRATMRGGYAKVYQPKENVIYQNKVALAFKEKYPNVYFEKEPLVVYITAYFKYPSNFTALQKELVMLDLLDCTKHKDVDNIAKNILDGLNKVAYADDKQIVSLNIVKRYSDKEYVNVCIDPIYNFNDLKLPIRFKDGYSLNINGGTSIIAVYDEKHNLLLEYDYRTGEYKKYDKPKKNKKKKEE